MTGTEADVPAEFVGYPAAAEYLGIKPDTLSNYNRNGYGPTPQPERRQVGQYLQYVYTREALDDWKANRRPGLRTDRRHTGSGRDCVPCGGTCEVVLAD
jgi:hypothetical protein